MISIIMGLDFDLFVMWQAVDVLKELDIFFEVIIVLAYWMLEWMFEFVKQAYGRGIKVIIVGVGGVVYLLGMVVFFLLLFVIGVFVKFFNLIDGWDLVLFIF